MSKPLTVVAVFLANPGLENELAASLQALVEPTRAEDGCLNYDLHCDLELTGRFLFYENWASREQWKAHMASAHLKAHKETSGHLVAEVEILQMEQTD